MQHHGSRASSGNIHHLGLASSAAWATQPRDYSRDTRVVCFDSANTASWECDGGSNPVLPLFAIRHYAVGTCTSWFTQPLWRLHEIREISTGQARVEGQVLRISDFRLLGTYRHREAGAGEGV